VVGTNTDDVVCGTEEELVEVSGKTTVVLVDVVLVADEVVGVVLVVVVSGTVVVVGTVARTVVDGAVVVEVVVDVVDEVIDAHKERLAIVR